uniref:Metalloproteinase n=1 Tax=Cryptophlebia leucotreta granulosis virus TaxID=35254 RepID=A0A2H4ZK84_GVCL|nr:metalloproteinase [Cryptophlebia leucotreta granulovirus]
MKKLIIIFSFGIIYCFAENLSLNFYINNNGTLEEIDENTNHPKYIINTEKKEETIVKNQVENPVENPTLDDRMSKFLINSIRRQFDLGSRRSKRFFIEQQYFWSNRENITYSLFTNTLPDILNLSIVKQETLFAFRVWEEAVYYKNKKNIVTFFDVGNNNIDADIKILFKKSKHEDWFNFDGLGGVLAHGFKPPKMGVKEEGSFEGEVHLDSEELWLTQNEKHENGTYYLPVLVHEIGHALGLLHSSVKKSLMYSYYNSDHISLNKDDVNGLEQLYINNNYTKNFDIPGWVYEKVSNSVDEICDFIPKCVTCIRGEYYIFGDNKYWRFEDFEFTRLIETHSFKTGLWPELCEVIGAVGINEKILFVDNNLWFEYKSTTLDRVRILSKNKYTILFVEDNTLFGVVGGQYLYEIMKDDKNEITDVYRGLVNEKFEGIKHLDWVIINKSTVSAGIGRGRWDFVKITSNPKVGNVYKIIKPIEPLMHSC